MKKIIYSIFAVFLIAACSKDTLDTPSEDLTAELVENSKMYKGIFTTDDAAFRGTIQIDMTAQTTSVSNTEPGRAMLMLSEGDVEVAYAKESRILDTGQRQITFGNEQFSFILTTDANGKNPTVSEVNYQNLRSTMLVANHSQREPVVPISGTWICTNCNGHPNVNMGSEQTFSMMTFTNASGDSDFDTMATLGGTTYMGIGTQAMCTADGITTECAISSGDGVSTTTGFLVNGNPVTWSGDHTFNNEATGPQDCSGVSGTWNWMSNSYGLLSGTFVSDDSCFNLLYSNDFETFTAAGFAPMPTAGQLDSDEVIVTGLSDNPTFTYGDTGVTGDFARGLNAEGGVSVGGVYAFDINSGNSILGVQPIASDFNPGTFEFKINNPGAALSTVSINYTLFVNNDQERASSFNVSYSTDGVNFTPVAGLAYTSPEASDMNGFVAIAKSENVPASVPTSGDLYIRFSSADVSGAGSRDEFGIDNLVIQGY